MTAPTTSSNGTGDTAALVEQAARDRAKVMHAVYTGPDEPSLAAVGAQFNLSGARVGQEFKRFDLPVRSRGGGAIATETKPETPAAPKPAPKAATAVSPFVDRMRSEAQAELDRIDAEIKRLQDERQAVEQFHQAL